MLFHDRHEAGRELARELSAYSGRKDVLVLGLPRGGIPVAFEVAKALQVPLDVFLVCKLGVPGHEELAFGAIASGGVRILNHEVIRQWQIPSKVIEAIATEKIQELEKRESIYRGNKPPIDVRGRVVILVDDGLATGATMRAAIVSLRKLEPARIVVGVPVGAPESCSQFQFEADETICVGTPEPFFAVGMWYTDFSQTEDQEVHDLLSQAAIEFGATNPSCSLSLP